ncbi:cation transporter dimerization domain-containing protein [Clostridium hydrogenum]|uniref:cation transporter dimerization domain-containing protein n=1 Tax=Clostridium hydrogenum TaxID=2855764 RepID=UPI002E34650E|nr:hypothetical protein [Clostridium hydrogenum]
MKNIHHVHIWGLNESNIFFEAHVNLKQDILISETVKIYENIKHELKEHFDIKHITIQFEYNGCNNTEIVKNE